MASIPGHHVKYVIIDSYLLKIECECGHRTTPDPNWNAVVEDRERHILDAAGVEVRD